MGRWFWTLLASKLQFPGPITSDANPAMELEDIKGKMRQLLQESVSTGGDRSIDKKGNIKNDGRPFRIDIFVLVQGQGTSDVYLIELNLFRSHANLISSSPNHTGRLSFPFVDASWPVRFYHSYIV